MEDAPDRSIAPLKQIEYGRVIKGYIGMMEKKMEATIGLGLGLGIYLRGTIRSGTQVFWCCLL